MGVFVAMTALAQISKARRALEAARSLGDILDVRDQASGIEHFLKSACESREAQNYAAEIKVRAERKAGELLRKMPKAKPPGKKISDIVSDTSKSTKIQDVGLSWKAAQRLEDMAAVPAKEFEQLADAKAITAVGGEITSSAIQARGAAIKRDAKRKRNRKPVVHPVTGTPEVVSEFSELSGQFGTIYADPPWAYSNQGTRAATDDHYSTMSIDQLCELPVIELAADDAHLHLWTTNAFLPHAFDVMRAWGFVYKSAFIWVKPQMGIGNYWRVSHEYLLLGVRGDGCKKFPVKNLMSWAEYSRGKHSSKPEELRNIIERVSPGPYLELFGRKSIAGWTVFGNQVERMLV